MALNRKIKVIFSSRNTVGGAVNGDNLVETDISNLDIDFSGTRSRVFRDNSLDLTIYNAGMNTRNNVLKQGSGVEFYAGYEDEGMGLLYSGNVIFAQSQRQGCDWVTSIHAIDVRSIRKPFAITPVVMSFAPGSNAGDIMDKISALMGLVPIGKEMLADYVLPSGWVFAGTIAQAFTQLGRICKGGGYRLFVDLGEMVVYRQGGYSTYDEIELTTETGLLNFWDATDYSGIASKQFDDLIQAEKDSVKIVKKKTKKTSKSREKKAAANAVVISEGSDVLGSMLKACDSASKIWKAKTILLPSARPNGIAKITTNDFSSELLIDAFSFSGDNYGADADCTMELTLELY